MGTLKLTVVAVEGTAPGTWKVFYPPGVKTRGRPGGMNHTNEGGPESVAPHLAATASSSWFSFCRCSPLSTASWGSWSLNSTGSTSTCEHSGS